LIGAEDSGYSVRKRPDDQAISVEFEDEVNIAIVVDIFKSDKVSCTQTAQMVKWMVGSWMRKYSESAFVGMFD
jgi:hypothetical protein